MKKTLSINLNGSSFNIDEDAYNVLKEYLNELENKFKNEETKEIMNDIESRISELFKDSINENKNVITIVDVNYVISILGNPEQIGDEDDINNDKETKTDKEEKKKHRKFYRDIDNEFLGGVAAGLAAYTGIDVVLIRLLFILVTILGFGYIIPIYLILWIFVRPARTTAQKLEMKGVEPSIENIKNYLKNEEFKASAKEIESSFERCFKIIIRIIAICFCICFTAIGIPLIGFILLLIFNFLIGGGIFFTQFIPFNFLNDYFSFDPYINVLLAICSILIFTIPIIFFIRTTIRLINSSKNPRNKVWTWTWLIIWIVSLITFLIILFTNISSFNNYGNFRNTFSKEFVIQNELRHKEERFNAIKIKEGIKVELLKGSTCYIEIEGTKLDLKNINTEIKDNTLEIKIRPLNKIYTPTNTHKIIVHYTELENINLSHASVITNLNDSVPLLSNNLNIEMASAAVSELNVECKHLNIDVAPASSISLNGYAENLKLDLSSAAVANLENMEIENFNANLAAASVINGLNAKEKDIKQAISAIINE